MPRTKLSAAAAVRRGKRFRALRVAAGLTPTTFAARSHDVARALGRPYAPVSASQICHIEAGRNMLGTDSVRAVVAGVLGITRDALALCMDGRATPKAVLSSAKSAHSCAVEGTL